MNGNAKPSSDPPAAPPGECDHSMLDEEFMGEDLRPPEVIGDEKSADTLKRHQRPPGADAAVRADEVD